MKNESTLRQGVEGVMMRGVGEDRTDINNMAGDPGKWDTSIAGYNSALDDIRSRIPSMAEEILELVRVEVEKYRVVRGRDLNAFEEGVNSTVEDFISSLAGDGDNGEMI